MIQQELLTLIALVSYDLLSQDKFTIDTVHGENGTTVMSGKLDGVTGLESGCFVHSLQSNAFVALIIEPGVPSSSVVLIEYGAISAWKFPGLIVDNIQYDRYSTDYPVTVYNTGSLTNSVEELNSLTGQISPIYNGKLNWTVEVCVSSYSTHDNRYYLASGKLLIIHYYNNQNNNTDVVIDLGNYIQSMAWNDWERMLYVWVSYRTGQQLTRVDVTNGSYTIVATVEGIVQAAGVCVVSCDGVKLYSSMFTYINDALSSMWIVYDIDSRQVTNYTSTDKRYIIGLTTICS